MNMEKLKEYFAFISYSRKDKNVANWLHKRLETYTYPANLVRAENQPKDEKYIRPIFIDTKDLQSEHRPFEVGIQQALQSSKFLILICSRNSAESTYVNQEVRYFLESKGGNYDLVVPVFIDEVSELICACNDDKSEAKKCMLTMALLSPPPKNKLIYGFK